MVVASVAVAVVAVAVSRERAYVGSDYRELVREGMCVGDAIRMVLVIGVVGGLG